MTNGLAHAPRTFDEEAPVLGPRIAAGQAGHARDAGRSRVGQHLVAGGRAVADDNGSAEAPTARGPLGIVLQRAAEVGGGTAHDVTLRESRTGAPRVLACTRIEGS